MFHSLLQHSHVQHAPLGTTASLAQVGHGARVRITQIEGGQRLRKRLADLGLAVGMEVRLLRDARGHGPVIIAVRHDTRLALGWGMASKIMVRLEE